MNRSPELKVDHILTLSDTGGALLARWRVAPARALSFPIKSRWFGAPDREASPADVALDPASSDDAKCGVRRPSPLPTPTPPPMEMSMLSWVRPPGLGPPLLLLRGRSDPASSPAPPNMECWGWE
jgi:hypothetical protein